MHTQTVASQFDMQHDLVEWVRHCPVQHDRGSAQRGYESIDIKVSAAMIIECDRNGGTYRKEQMASGEHRQAVEQLDEFHASVEWTSRGELPDDAQGRKDRRILGKEEARYLEACRGTKRTRDSAHETARRLRTSVQHIGRW
jgi:hypothetical protein